MAAISAQQAGHPVDVSLLFGLNLVWGHMLDQKSENPATPSVFADWVFNQGPGSWRRNAKWRNANTNHYEERQQLLRCGKLDHAAIENLKKSYNFRNNFARISNYTPIYVDEEKALTASKLRYDGEPFLCKPDLVLGHQDHIIIVERKTTRRYEIPPEDQGWFNVECQLWCYSFVDDWCNYARITLVAEYWYNWGIKISMNRHFRWEKDDPSHQERCQDFFRRYGGKIQGKL